MELRVRLDEFVAKTVTNAEGREFTVYQCDADGYLVDLSLTKDVREELEQELKVMNYGLQIKCLFTSRTFEYNGRTIRVPQAKFVEFIRD